MEKRSRMLHGLKKIVVDPFLYLYSSSFLVYSFSLFMIWKRKTCNEIFPCDLSSSFALVSKFVPFNHLLMLCAFYFYSPGISSSTVSLVVVLLPFSLSNILFFIVLSWKQSLSCSSYFHSPSFGSASSSGHFILGQWTFFYFSSACLEEAERMKEMNPLFSWNPCLSAQTDTWL